MANKHTHPRNAVWRNFTEEDINNLPTTQQEAYDQDSIYYFTGRPCKNKHIAPKTRSNRYCVVCNSESYNKKKIVVEKIEVEKPEPILVLGMKLYGLLNNNRD
jgi:hypothetical protein